MALQAKIKDTSFAVGDKVRIFQKIQEGDKTRVQPFEGIVMGIRGEGENKMFTVRKIATGNIGVERIWPLNSPWIEKVTVVRKGQVRRAKLYFLREHPNKLRFAQENENRKTSRRPASK